MTVTYHEPGFLVSLDDEQRARYYDWWQRYLLWRRVAIIVAAIAFATVVAYSLLLPMLFPDQILLYRIAGVVRKPAFLIAIGVAILGSLMDCPRCGESFRGWFGRRYLADECQNCGLSYAQLSSIGKPTYQA